VSDEEEELPTATAVARYEWDCPECGTTNDVEPGVDYGDEECGQCGETVRVVEG